MTINHRTDTSSSAARRRRARADAWSPDDSMEHLGALIAAGKVVPTPTQRIAWGLYAEGKQLAAEVADEDGPSAA